MIRPASRRGLAGLVGLCVVTAVGCRSEDPPEPPRLEDAELVLPGFDSLTVPLVDGMGAVEDEEGVQHVRASLTDWRALGDFDGDGTEDALVVVWSSGGGSGTFIEVAHFRREADRSGPGERWLWAGSAMLGDRVRVRALTVTDGRVELHVTQHGPEDPMCCPTQVAVRAFEIRNGKLVESTPGVD